MVRVEYILGIGNFGLFEFHYGYSDKNKVITKSTSGGVYVVFPWNSFWLRCKLFIKTRLIFLDFKVPWTKLRKSWFILDHLVFLINPIHLLLCCQKGCNVGASVAASLKD